MLFFVTQTMLMKHKIIDSNYSTCRKSKTEMCNQILFRKTRHKEGWLLPTLHWQGASFNIARLQPDFASSQQCILHQ